MLHLNRTLLKSYAVYLVTVLMLVLIPWSGSAQIGARTWGYNNSGQLGDGTTSDRHSPVVVSGIGVPTAVSGGGLFSLALQQGGRVWSWGSNDFGQLGDGTYTDRSTPMQVPGLVDIVAISAGGNHSLAIKADGTAWGWGINNNGELGNGMQVYAVPSPVQVSLSGVVAVSAGFRHSLGLTDDGAVWAWGYDDFGQVGDNSHGGNRLSPIQVAGLKPAIAVAAGAYYSLALRSDGTVWGWGWNQQGEVGDGTTVQRDVPVQVSGLSGIVAIAAGYYHGVALRTDGTVWAWGDNQYGQLGDGTTINRPTPVRVSGLSGITAIAASGWFTLALKQDGTLWAWGNNFYGQCGDGTTTNHSLPVRVPGLGGVVSFAAGAGHTLILVPEIATRVEVEHRTGTVDRPVTLRATVTRADNGTFLGARYVEFSVDGSKIGQALTGIDGIAAVSWTIPLSYGPGDHAVTANFSGDGEFSASDGDGVLTASKPTPTLTWETPSWYQYGQIGETVLLTAHLASDLDNSPLAYRRLAFTLGGTEVGRNNTGANGRLTLPVTLTEALGLGSKTLTATFDGDNLYSAATATTTFSIYKTDPVITIDPVSGRVGQSITLKAHLVHSWTHAPLSGRKVVFSVAGTWIGAATTDATGTASLSYTIPAWLGTGAKSVTVRFDSDATTYSASRTSDALNIIP